MRTSVVGKEMNVRTKPEPERRQASNHASTQREDTNACAPPDSATGTAPVFVRTSMNATCQPQIVT